MIKIMSSKTYICLDCEERLELIEYYPDTSKRGHTKRCKVCFDIYTKYKEKDKTGHCNWCFGYGVFPVDGRPLGIHEVKQGFPSTACPVCGANWSKKIRSTVNPLSNPKYPW